MVLHSICSGCSGKKEQIIWRENMYDRLAVATVKKELVFFADLMRWSTWIENPRDHMTGRVLPDHRVQSPWFELHSDSWGGVGGRGSAAMTAEGDGRRSCCCHCRSCLERHVAGQGLSSPVGWLGTQTPSPIFQTLPVPCYCRLPLHNPFPKLLELHLKTTQVSCPHNSY